MQEQQKKQGQGGNMRTMLGLAAAALLVTFTRANVFVPCHRHRQSLSMLKVGAKLKRNRLFFR
jgi:hypothetical protein